jgi:hypothetical protein
MKYLLTLLLIASLFSCVNENKTDKKNEKKGNKKIEEIVENVTKDFLIENDLSSLIMAPELGAFGENFQRIMLEFIEIKKDIYNPHIYSIKGTTEMKKKKVGFEGTINIESIEKSNYNPYNFYDSTYTTLTVYANYKFIEDKSVENAGIFTGKLEFTLVADKSNKLSNDLYDWWLDGYSNFHFQGKWTSKDEVEFKCIFGDGRLRDCDELNGGDGMFIPNEKYKQYGWEDYLENYWSTDSTENNN